MRKAQSIVILTDTREVCPLNFLNLPSEHATLKTGDYSCRVGDLDLRDRISIERKSVSDLVSSLSTGRVRFENEMERLAKIRWRFLLVERELSVVARGTAYSKMTARQIIGPLLAWQMKYDLHVVFAANRAWAARIVELLLMHAARYVMEESQSDGCEKYGTSRHRHRNRREVL